MASKSRLGFYIRRIQRYLQRTKNIELILREIGGINKSLVEKLLKGEEKNKENAMRMLYRLIHGSFNKQL